MTEREPGSRMIGLPLRRTQRASPDQRVEQELAEREEEAKSSSPEAVGYHLNRCGDVALAAGLQVRAVDFYGRAVDAYLRVGYWRPAAAMCRKILRIHPEAVRAHCTLACIAMHERQTEDVRRHLRDFADASKRTGTEPLAVLRLRQLAPLVRDAELRGSVIALLDELCDALGCEHIHRGRLAPSHADESLPATVERLIRIATAGARELWEEA